MTLSWLAGHTGWLLQSNSISLTNPAAWFSVDDSTNVNSVSFPVNQSAGQVLYRLRH